MIGRPPTCLCGECAKCKHRLVVRRWAESNRERARQLARETRQRNLETVRARDRARGYRPGDPEKRRARRRVATAIANGTLMRLPCEVCGKTDVQAHHDDYGKPLDVRWLCTTHHGELHRLAA